MKKFVKILKLIPYLLGIAGGIALFFTLKVECCVMGLLIIAVFYSGLCEEIEKW